MLILLLVGRIIPGVTRNWRIKQSPEPPAAGAVRAHWRGAFVWRLDPVLTLPNPARRQPKGR